MNIVRHDHLDQRAMLLLLGCCAFWGLQQILIKATLAEIPPLWQSSLRFAAATAALMLWCRWRGIALWGADGSLGAGLLAGALFATEFLLIYAGLTYTTASRMTVFVYTSPFWVALLVPLRVPTERLRPLQWVGLVVAFGGVALAFAEGLLQEKEGQLLGDLMALGAGLAWGLTTLVLRGPTMANLTPEKTLFYQIGVTTLAAPLVSLWWGEPWGFMYSAQAWGSVAAQALLGAFVTYLTWMWLLRHYPATRVAAFAFLTPIFGLLFAVTLLGERPSLQLLLALGGVVLGIGLVNRGRTGSPTAVKG
jgi:drug/metabolite transporter (DMT)-like permease